MFNFLHINLFKLFKHKQNSLNILLTSQNQNIQGIVHVNWLRGYILSTNIPNIIVGLHACILKQAEIYKIY